MTISKNLTFAAAQALLHNIADYTNGDYEALGVTKANFQLVNAPIPWKREQRHVVMRTVNVLIFGTLEIMGISKIRVPAEYVAAVVVSCVSPANIMVCCGWLEEERQTGMGAQDLASRDQQTSQLDAVSKDQLFALCCLLAADEEAGYARIAMAERLGMAIRDAEEGSLQQ